MIVATIIRIANKYLPLLKAITFVWLILIALLCLIPQNDLPKVGLIPHLDKLVHFSLYFVLILLSLIIYQKSKIRSKIIVMTGIFGFSLLIEIMQGILPFGRTFSLTDLLANLSGILTGFLLFRVVKVLPGQTIKNT